MDSRECSGVLIVCIGIGKTAQSHYMGSSKEGIINTQQLYVRKAIADSKIVDLAAYYWEMPKTFKFKTVQEAARKDIERAFGVLQEPNMVRSWVERCDLHVRKAKELRDRKTHIDLRQDLVEHLWNNQ
ncbi:ALP1-like protein isoform X1 [Tanacetum coccineum]